jgi:hypothetical protein
MVAVDGEIISIFSYRSSHHFLNQLSGIKIATERGMQLEVQGVDHLNMGTSDCEGFEQYSHPDVFVN